MKKKIVLLSIIIFPSLIYFLFELTQANFKKMPYFGPRTLDEKGDTVYYALPNNLTFGQYFIDAEWPVESSIAKLTSHPKEFVIDTARFPVYCILFLDKNLRREGYKLDGLIDYIKYKPKDLKDIPIFFVSQIDSAGERPLKVTKPVKGLAMNGEFDSIPARLPNFIPLRVSPSSGSLSEFISKTYFKGKPEYVFDYFMVLVDKKRHIRGYYDPTYNAEVKRMIDEYKHLKIRDEYAETLKQNDIKQNEKK
jgi:hypothetical protein